MFCPIRRQLSAKTMPIDTTYILYDIPGTSTKHQAWSPNVWKTRCVRSFCPASLRRTCFATESFSTTKEYPTRRNGLNFLTLLRLQSALVHRIRSCDVVGSHPIQSPSFMTQPRIAV